VDSRQFRTYVAFLLVATIGAVALARGLQLQPASPPAWATLPFLAAALVTAEHLRVRFRRGHDVVALTLFEAALAPLIFGFSTTTVVATVFLAQLTTALIRRLAFPIAAFNIVQWSLTAAVGSIVLNSLVTAPGIRLRSLGCLVIALAVVALLNNTLVTLAIAIRRRQGVRSVLRQVAPIILPGWLGGWGINFLVGVLFVLAIGGHPIAVVLFPVPLVVLHLAYKGYATARAEGVRLSGIRTAVQLLSEPLQPWEVIDDYLREVARCFDAGGSALILTDSGICEVHQIDAQGNASLTSRPRDELGLESVLASQPDPIQVSATGTDSTSRLLKESGWRSCLAAPLVDENRRLGALIVYDQAGLELDTRTELTVLEGLARETAHTLARGRLLETVLEERRKLDQIVSTTSDGIFTLDDDGVVLTWNVGCEQITGLSANDVVGTRNALSRLKARTGRGAPIDFAGWSNGVALPAEVVITRLDGVHRRLSCSFSTATDVDDKSQTLVVVARDITPAEEYQELQEQFGRLVEAQAAQRLVVDHLQQAVAPEPPGIAGADIAVAYVASDPSSPTGGDLFDWHMLPSGELHVAVIDVLGHGVTATKDALTVVHTLRFAALDGTPLERMVQRADELLSAQSSDLVATVVIARYQPETGIVKVVSGGHPPALVVGADGEVRQLTATGGAIGWPAVGSDNVVTARLGVNESLVLYTDGLIEARKNVLDGLESLMHHAGDVAQLPASQFADELVKRSLEGADRRDDTLALVLRRTRTKVLPTRMSWDVTPGNAFAMRSARKGLEQWLAEQDAHSEDAVLVAAELLANAVVAARSSVVLSAVLQEDQAVLEVSDDGAGAEHLDDRGQRLPRADSEAGRGLFLVRALSDRVSMMSTAAGTVVRCVVPARRRTAATTERLLGS
jgi:PAS domain S-box-containing protein